MNPTLPLYVLLLGNTPLSRDFSPTIEAYSARWSVRFSQVSPVSSERAPDSNASAHTPTDLSAQAEGLLDRASTALSALRESEARSALSEAARLLYAHPELPEAVWLMAEHHVLSSELPGVRGEGDSARLRASALALEGARAEPFREGTSAGNPAASLPHLQASIIGVTDREVVEWDGEVRSLPIFTPSGEHRLRVFRGERVVWAGWVSVNEAQPLVKLELDSIAPCSAEDFEGTRWTASGPLSARGVRCALWAVASPTKAGLRIALCHGSRCGKFHEPVSPGDPFRPPAQPFVMQGLPRWALWAAAGVGAAAATSLVLWQAGAFAEGTGARERWVYEGLR